MSAGLETYAVRQAEQGLHAFVHWGGTQVRHGPGAYTTGLHVDLGNLMDQGFRGAMCRVVWAPTAEWHKNQSVSKTVYKRHSAAARPERGGGGGGPQHGDCATAALTCGARQEKRISRPRGVGCMPS